jgi:alpha-maltose-1-phosphate synthase
MTLRVVQVSHGRFHHFDLARQLAKRGALTRFYTGYPRWKLRGEGIPQDRVNTYPWDMTLYMGLLKLGWLRSIWQQPMERRVQDTLDRHVSRTLPDCDVVIALSGSGLRTAAVARRRGVRFVCDRGSSHIRCQDKILREEYARWGEHFAGIDRKAIDREEAEYAAADVITVPSEFAFRSFVDMGISPAKLRKVPYGVDLRHFGSVALPDPAGFDVLFVGQVSLRKGVPDLLKAFAQVEHPRKRLRIVGAMQPEVQGIFHKLAPSTGVELLGQLPQRKLAEVMSSAHVMVLPSVEEGLALVQAQALACGCPVVSTWNTGATDLFTDGVEGYIVPPRDPETIAARLQALADDSDLRSRMSAAALARAGQLCGWDVYGDQMMRVLTDAVERHMVSRTPSISAESNP